MKSILACIVFFCSLPFCLLGNEYVNSKGENLIKLSSPLLLTTIKWADSDSLIIITKITILSYGMDIPSINKAKIVLLYKGKEIVGESKWNEVKKQNMFAENKNDILPPYLINPNINVNSHYYREVDIDPFSDWVHLIFTKYEITNAFLFNLKSVHKTDYLDISYDFDISCEVAKLKKNGKERIHLNKRKETNEK